MFLLLLLLIGIPVIEIYLFIEIGGEIGALSTILMIFLTAIVGALMVRKQGIETLMTARQKMDAKKAPSREIFDGVCILVAGALLITPGFFTDGLGFLLLWPAARTFILSMITDEMFGMYTFGIVDTEMAKKGYDKAKDKAKGAKERFTSRKLKEKQAQGKASGKVVDADFEEID